MAGTRARIGVATLVVAGVLVAFGLAAFASPFASNKPDGLNKVAADHGFDAPARNSATADSPLAGYGVKHVDNEKVSKGSAGIVGVAVTLLVATVAFATLRHFVRRRSGDSPSLTGGM
jgi:cobalt/nickel transport system permease protein